MAKSAEAFRTISEVAEWLGSPAHVLRFWESKFTQVKPVKRAGGRRYYRPADMLLLGGIKKLLHDDGMTIKGVQKILREHGVKHVADLSRPLEAEDDDAVLDGTFTSAEDEMPDSAQVLQFQRGDGADRQPAALPESPAAVEEPQSDDAEAAAGSAQADAEPAEPDAVMDHPIEAEPQDFVADPDSAGPEDVAAPQDAGTASLEAEGEAEAEEVSDTTETESVSEPEPAGTGPEDEEGRLTDIPAFLHRPGPAESAAADDDGGTGAPAPDENPEEIEVAAAPRPEIIELPADPSDDEIDAAPGILALIAARKGRRLPASTLDAATGQRDKLAALITR